MKTSVTVYGDGNSSTSILSIGEVGVHILPVSNDLEVRVVEDGAEIKKFYFRAGHWNRYSVIKSDL